MVYVSKVFNIYHNKYETKLIKLVDLKKSTEQNITFSSANRIKEIRKLPSFEKSHPNIHMPSFEFV